MSSTGYCPARAPAVVEPEQSGHAAAVSGHTGVDALSGLGRTGTAVAGGAGEALGQVVAGLRGAAGVPVFQAGIEAGQRELGNRAFMRWVRALGAAKQADAGAAGGVKGPARPVAGVPVTDCDSLQLMGKKKKQQQAADVKAGSGNKAAGTEGDAGAGPEGAVAPGPAAAQPQATGTAAGVETEPVGGAAAGAQKKKKKSRVQVALNTLRGQGVAAFGGYIEAEIDEAVLLRTLVERINRAEDLKNVRAEALAGVEARLGLLDAEGGAGETGSVAQPRGSPPMLPAAPFTPVRAGGQEPEFAEIAPVNTEFNWRERELFEACFMDDTRRMRRFFKAEFVDLNKGSRNGTLLCLAAGLGRKEFVRELLPLPDLDVNLAQQEGATPLCLAAQQGYEDVVKLLLDKDGINVNLAAPSGATPLYIAAQNGHAGVVIRLLGARGINVNPALVETGATPLIAVAQFGRKNIVKLLLAAPGIDIDMRQTDGATALFMAARDNCLGIVEELIRCGADVNLALHTGETPLGAAARQGNLEIVRYLLQLSGIGVELANESGIGPLAVAAQRGHLEIARLLLGKGANPDRVNIHGFTQLHRSCLNGNEAVVRMLVAAGADTAVEVTGPYGTSYTPYDLARLAGHREVMSVLAAHPRRREAWPPRPERLPITGEPDKTAPRPGSLLPQGLPLGQAGGQAASPQALSPAGAVAGKQEVRAAPAARDSEVSGEQDPAGQATARVSPVPPSPSPPGQATPVREAPTPLAQARDGLRQEVLGKLRADNLDEHEGMELLMAVNATTGMDRLCTLYNRLAHIERREERARRRKRRREVLPVSLGAVPAAADPAAAPEFALGGKTGLDAEGVEGEIKKHLHQRYHRFVSQAVNDMEFGRGKRTTGYPELWHVSAGIPGVGSCSVFYYLDAVRNRIRIVGTGRHVGGRAAYQLDYAAEELGAAGRILRIA